MFDWQYCAEIWNLFCVDFWVEDRREPKEVRGIEIVESETWVMGYHSALLAIRTQYPHSDLCGLYLVSGICEVVVVPQGARNEVQD